MSELSLKFVTSHPRTDWLRVASLNSRMPNEVLPHLIDIEKACALLQGTKLHPVKGLSEKTSTTFVLSFPPLPGFSRQTASYLMISTAECDEISRGSAVFIARIPDIEKKEGELTAAEKAENIFRDYTKMLEELIFRVGARPFACLTGCEVDRPAYDLQLRSFKFFFGSSDVDRLYSTVREILTTNRDLIQLPARLKQMVLDGEITSIDARQIANRRVELQTTLQQLKSVLIGQDPVRHSILDEVMLEISDTTLVDLR